MLELEARTRDKALREIVATIELAEPETFLQEVIAREGVQTTLVSHGIAFPHARTNLLERIVLGIGRSVEGVSFGPGQRAHLIFVIGIPQRMVSDYLVCVGALARLTRDEVIRQTLMRAETAGEFVELLRTGSLVLE
jgi:mannitol/fructose-specific phosphotransferase system IIA component (Ntr-type)